MPDIGLITYGLFGSAIYLDTNVWSELAKGTLPLEKLDSLVGQGNAYLSLGPYQLLELGRRPDLGPGLADLFRRTTVCMSSRSASSELAGQTAWTVGFEFFITLKEF